MKYLIFVLPILAISSCKKNDPATIPPDSNFDSAAVFGGTKDDVFTAVYADFDNIIIAGYTESSDGDITGHHGGKDLWIVSLDHAGKKLWSKVYGGSKDDVATSIGWYGGSGYLISGYTESSDGDVSSNHGGRDGWLIKIDNAGNLVWEKTYGTANNDDFKTMNATTSGGVILSGTANDDHWIAHIAMDGTLNWEKSFGSSALEYPGFITEVTGRYYITGSAKAADGDFSDKPTNSYDAYVILMTTSGEVLWKRYVAGAGDERALFVSAIRNDDTYTVYGTTQSKDLFPDLSGSQNIFAATFEKNGTLLWNKVIQHSTYDEPLGLTGTRTLSSVILGQSQNAENNSLDGSIITIDPTNALVNDTRMLGGRGTEAVMAGGAVSFTHYVFAGYTDTYGKGGKDGWCGFLEFP